MTTDEKVTEKEIPPSEAELCEASGPMPATNVGNSIDMLVEYLVDNGMEGIHPLIMGEVEKRLIIKTLERSRGNKAQAAKMLGMSRNTLHRKCRQLNGMGIATDENSDV
jgi:transcriptional regulator of acetoin/glycerol metabolism